ncbi:tRNA (adenosine(37)-N6)-dimethylallyltransferase MiaA [Capnocytophaga sputigena]|jgi:tRNA dimethylallyltransferase|uniref:tRNA (adenosine(37)-N6)-dimethylallyltransferase MiaA n=1 Tax=Capnocytophaga sputigena TaxID=1019 RepID=UPI000BB1EBE5|nr:tRNA (adenosine(37)-N6)-dimethylallyltransferase MiaA [Capnocytophaga sputigena]ATA71690.1 tRNA (adenosine(37)-N6)-dimethylallyltransferase MiaA [Capnocytophaga sputigena]PBN46012.1 tRNA (adenosine(37)-N6)-dimethylallyltransferase MiaA [Capnocytophaga sputigena]VEI56827.1 tRNA dimethylallyltransferase [Capnocytophaga sputigena]
MQKKNKKILLTVVGPTAIGKTSLAIDLALHFGTEIISCDSRQFFKEMSIGTAVPSSEELAQVKHHFIQHKSIFDTYSVGDFERDAITLLKELFKQHNVVIMVGGSGLYADTVVYGLDDFPEVSPEIRNELNELYQKQGITYLQTRLKDLDPIQYTQIDVQNPQRMMRALEVCIASGKPYSSFLNKKETLRDFTNITIGLTAEREVVYNRINERVELMLENGLLIEAQTLFPHKKLNALQTVGYRELFNFFEGKTSLDFAIEEIKKNTRRFAKRQYTWFHKNKDINWFEINQLDKLSICQLLDM